MDMIYGGFTPKTGNFERSEGSESLGRGRQKRPPLHYDNRGMIDCKDDDAVFAASIRDVR